MLAALSLANVKVDRLEPDRHAEWVDGGNIVALAPARSFPVVRCEWRLLCGLTPMLAIGRIS